MNARDPSGPIVRPHFRRIGLSELPKLGVPDELTERLSLLVDGVRSPNRIVLSRGSAGGFHLESSGNGDRPC